MPRPRSFDEDAVLDRVVDLFWSRGYEATSLSDLEGATGLGRQSLYNAFGDKQALFLRVLERYAGEGRSRLVPLHDPAIPGAVALRRYFDVAAAVLGGPGERRGCLLANTIAEVGDGEPAVAGACRDSARDLVAALTAAVRRGTTDGTLDPALDVSATARTLQALAYGLSAMAKTGAPRRALAAAVDGVLDRLAPPSARLRRAAPA